MVLRRLPVLLLLGVHACDGAGSPEDRGVGGTPIVESSPPYVEWSLEPAPVTRIGAMDGPPESQFSRVVYAARLSDGRLLVFDGASSELRWFDADGELQLRSGGRGEGPGEFLRVVSAMVTPQDSVVLYDYANQRLTWFGPGGALGRTLRADLHPMVRLVALQDARVVIAEERPALHFGGAEYNLAHDSLLIMMTGSASQPLDTVMHRVGREAATWIQYEDGQPIATRQFGLPFGHPTLVGAASDRIVLIENGRVDLTFFDEGGEAIRSAHRTDVDPPALTAALRREYVSNAAREARERGVPERIAQASAEGLLEVIPEGRRVSPFDRMLTDAVTGRIWVRDYRFAWSADEAQRWTVYDENGRVLARMTTPPGVEIMHAGPDHLVGVERDGMGVEHVVVYSFATSG